VSVNPDPRGASAAKDRERMRCERCGRFVGEEALEGWSGGLFGDYNGLYYCAFGVGCNSVESAAGREREENPFVLD